MNSQGDKVCKNGNIPKVTKFAKVYKRETKVTNPYNNNNNYYYYYNMI